MANNEILKERDLLSFVKEEIRFIRLVASDCSKIIKSGGSLSLAALHNIKAKLGEAELVGTHAFIALETYGKRTFRNSLTARNLKNARNLIELLHQKVSSLDNKAEMGREFPPTIKERSRTSQPSANARFLLYLFLSKQDRDAGLGDAIEEFEKHVKLFGKRRAKILFYQQVALSAWPFIRRVVAKSAGLLLLGKWLRKFIS